VGGEARHALKAGYGHALLDFPVGMSLGGFSSRVQPNDGQYGGGLSQSVGAYDALDARALLLDNGENPVLLIRVPLIFLDMSLHEQVARALQARTGRDWRDHLVISATHTHSGPARLWPLPAQTLIPLGLFGIGDFSEEIHTRLANSIITAAAMALDNTFDARFGWKIVESFDVQDQVGHDRRGATPPFDDNRALLMRVDDAQGNPRVVLFSYGAHGTLSANNYITSDALGGSERMMEEAFGRRFGELVPAMYINQNSGTMAPTAPRNHEGPQGFERHGLALVAQTEQHLVDIVTSSDVPIQSRTSRFAINYERMGYQPGEWMGASTELPLGGELYYGGVQCSGGFEGNPDYSDFLPESELTCLGLHAVVFNRAPTLFLRTQMTALKIAGLNVITMPGELSMELSWLVLRGLRDRFQVDPLQAWTMGYAQDHHLYLLTDQLSGDQPPFPGISLPQALSTYPERAFSLLRGGYESSLVPWGVRSAAFYVERAMTSWERLTDETAGGPDAHVAPLIYSPRGDPLFTVDLTPVVRAGVVVSAPPAAVSRLTPLEFVWVGGDPGAEAPQAPLVTLQRRGENMAFSDVTLPSHRPYTNHAARILTHPRKIDGDWQWVARWEELADFPAGTYRFHVEGHHLVEPGTAGRRAYALDSTPFVLEPISTLRITAALDGATIRGTLSYPPGATLQDSPTNTDRGGLGGHYRLRHPEVPVNLPAPVEPVLDVVEAGVVVQVMGQTLIGMTLSTALETMGGLGNVPVTHFAVPLPAGLASGEHQVTVDVTDLHGNTGTLSVMITVP